MRFVHFDAAAFLRDVWQRRPLLIRNPWAQWRNPLEPDELAGLAGEEGVESRLVERVGASWSLEHGPIAAERFGEIGAHPWTLLVQSVDHYVPEVAALVAPFRFVPNWRIDDVMVSYAVDGGGVGPHFDQYDVFLVQGLGRRRWRVGAACDEAAELLAHDDLRLLRDFAATEEWVLEPGDILYLPPRFAHDGVAVGDDCMTYSIGFRAPSRRELISAWCDEAVCGLGDDDRYADPGLPMQANPGEITADALAGLHAMIAQKLADREAFAAWFGRHATLPRDPEADYALDEPGDARAVRRALGQGGALVRNPASRFAFVERGGEADVRLFVDGREFACADDVAGLARRLCGRDPILRDGPLSDKALALVVALIDQGSLAFAEDE